MAVISNGTTLIDAGAIDSGIAKGAMTLISTLTADNSASTLTFASGITSTYDEYQFKFINMHCAANDGYFQVNFRDGGTDYDAPKTTTFHRAQHSQGGAGAELAYSAGDDLVNATGVQRLSAPTGSDNDECLSGTMKFYQPASTVFHKHFMSTISNLDMSDYEVNVFVAGFCNVTAAITGVQFSYSTGNIQSGIIKMYGVSK